MKLEQKREFTPVTVTLETRGEAAVFAASMTTGQIPNGHGALAHKMAMEIGDFMDRVLLDGEGSGDLD